MTILSDIEGFLIRATHHQKMTSVSLRDLSLDTAVPTATSEYILTISLDKNGYQVNIFLFLHENKCLGYSLEAPQCGTSNEYPQHMFLWRNKENISTFYLKKVPYLELLA